MSRSNASRIRFLERQERERVASVDALKMKQVKQALAFLSKIEQEALRTVSDTSLEHYAYLDQLLEIFKSESIFRDVEAHAWHDKLYDNPDIPWTKAPFQAKENFDAESDSIAWFAHQADSSSELQASAKWAAAYWRYMAALAQVIGSNYQRVAQ